MELKMIVAGALVLFIIGALVWLHFRNRNKDK